MQKRVSIPFGPRNKLWRERVQHVRLLQLNPVQHRPQGRPSDSEKGIVCVTGFDESFPKFSAFSDRAQCDWIADDRHERLCSRNRSVQQFGVWQEAEVEVGEVLLQWVNIFTTYFDVFLIALKHRSWNSEFPPPPHPTPKNDPKNVCK